jgi:hypothetical protein
VLALQASYIKVLTFDRWGRRHREKSPRSKRVDAIVSIAVSPCLKHQRQTIACLGRRSSCYPSGSSIPLLAAVQGAAEGRHGVVFGRGERPSDATPGDQHPDRGMTRGLDRGQGSSVYGLLTHTKETSLHQVKSR